MKRVTPSEARRRWFELLDDVIAGEEVVIERNVDDADGWGWEWTQDGLAPRDLPR